ncbi:MAG: hypothetical protein AB8H86_12260 [Polyangiales bacterium]
MVFTTGCTVAIDDFERCEALTFEVERGSCEGEMASCTIACLNQVTGEEERGACLRACEPDGSPCLECIFNINLECAIQECQEAYQDLSCCSLDRCGMIDFECEACAPEIDAFGQCASTTVVDGAPCNPELIRDCYQE